MATPRDEQSAPWYRVPEERVVSVEHPCLVKNKLKGIGMLGGSGAIAQTLELGTERTLALSFNPEDPSSRTVLSLHHRTNNVLLKVTVPRRTGRKRKRGSDDPFVTDDDGPSPATTATQLLQSMSDNVNAVTVEPVADITSTHVWRNMPDLAFTTKGSKFMREVERTILPKDYLLMKEFSLSRSSGPEEPENVPPPVLSTQTLPYHYFYRQNQAIFKIPETGGSAPLNKLAAPKTYTHQWVYDSPGVPTGPMEGCPPVEQQPQQVQTIVTRLRPLFEQRPLWTRRALLNQLPKDATFFFAKHAIAYVAFPIKSGPWRDTLCRFGVDPRTDRQYRKYQTIAIQIANAQKDAALINPVDKPTKHWVNVRDTESHVFDGIKPVPADGKVWQLCDLEEIQLKHLVDVEDLFIRPECEIRYFGWYPNGIYAKIKILLKVKVDRLLAGKTNEPALFKRFLKLPDRIDAIEGLNIVAGDLSQGYLPRDVSKDELEWATAYRNVMKTPLGAVPTYGAMGKGRTSIAKPKARPSYLANEMYEEDEETILQSRGSHNGDDDVNVMDAFAEPMEEVEDEVEEGEEDREYGDDGDDGDGDDGNNENSAGE